MQDWTEQHILLLYCFQCLQWGANDSEINSIHTHTIQLSPECPLCQTHDLNTLTSPPPPQLPTHTHTYDVHPHKHTRARSRARAHTHTPHHTTHTRARARTHTHARTRTHTHAHARTRTLTLTHTTHIHIHTGKSYSDLFSACSEGTQYVLSSDSKDAVE